MDVKLEVVALPVADVDRAKDFCKQPGWRPDADFTSGPDPARRGYASFASFHDPDGNGWLLQEITVRLPGR